MAKTNFDAGGNQIGTSEKSGNIETHYDNNGNRVGSSVSDGTFTRELDGHGNLRGYSTKNGNWTTNYDKSLNKTGYSHSNGSSDSHYDSSYNSTGSSSNSGSSDSGSSSGGCFLSTACSNGIGLPDNCPELQSLRIFRDTYLNNTQDGKNLIKEYYQIAPGILKAIENRGDSHQILVELFDNLVKPTVELIEKGNYETAVAHYKNCVLQLKNKLGC